MRKNKILRYFLLLLFLLNMALIFIEIIAITHNRHQDEDEYTDMVNALIQTESDIRDFSVIRKGEERYTGGDISSINIEGKDYIGVLEIPSMDIKLPILKEFTYPNLQIAPCRFYGSIGSSNIIIGGHNYPTHFGSLQGINPGDSINFTDAKGDILKYKVVNTNIIGAKDVTELLEGNWDLTLFTCTTDGRQRVVVKSKLTE